MKRLLLIAALAACNSVDDAPVVGPFAGPVHRFTVDRLTFPTDRDASLALGDDLDGAAAYENQLGIVVSELAIEADATTSGNDMIAVGVISSVVDIQAADLESGIAGVTFHGAATDAGTPMGGTFVAGSLQSNRTRTSQALGSATAVLPVFADADPSRLDLTDMEIDLTPDGQGGYDAIVRGGIPPASAKAATVAGIRQMIADNPSAHVDLARILDANHDGKLTDDEILTSGLIESLVAPDLASGLLSAAFGAHLVPCASGTCVTAAPVDLCHDRVRDGDELDIDCGGSCMACSGPRRDYPESP